MVPVTNVDAQTVPRQRDSDRAKIIGWIGKKIFASDHFVRRAVALHAQAQQLTLAEVGEKQIAVKLRWQGVLVVTQGAGCRAAAVVSHAPERVGPAWNEVVRIAIKPAVHHVRHARHPLLLVGVVVGEDLLLGVDRHIENVADTGAINFQLSAIRAQPQNAPAVKVNAPAVASALGRLMSIGSSATKTRPSCAQATTDGCLTWGAWATSSMRQFGIGCGRTEAPKAEKLQKITKETKSERRNNSPFAIFGI